MSLISDSPILNETDDWLDELTEERMFISYDPGAMIFEKRYFRALDIIRHALALVFLFLFGSY